MAVPPSSRYLHRSSERRTNHERSGLDGPLAARSGQVLSRWVKPGRGPARRTPLPTGRFVHSRPSTPFEMPLIDRESDKPVNRYRPAGRAVGGERGRVLSSGFHRRLIRYAHDAGDSSRLVSRPRTDARRPAHRALVGRQRLDGTRSVRPGPHSPASPGPPGLRTPTGLSRAAPGRVPARAAYGHSRRGGGRRAGVHRGRCVRAGQGPRRRRPRRLASRAAAQEPPPGRRAGRADPGRSRRPRDPSAAPEGANGSGSVPDPLNGISMPVPDGWTGQAFAIGAQVTSDEAYKCPGDTSETCTAGGAYSAPALALGTKGDTAEAGRQGRHRGQRRGVLRRQVLRRDHLAPGAGVARR